MSYSFYFFYFCLVSCAVAMNMQSEVVIRSKNQSGSLPHEFPKTSTDSSIPIVSGEDPTSSKVPPRIFPSDKNSSGPSIISGSNLNITEVKNNNHSIKLDSPVKKIPESTNSTLENTTKTNEKPKVEVATAEQDDMLNSKYTGGQDVDEVKSEKKASEKDEKKPTISKKDPKSEVTVTPNFDKKGPKFMNESRAKSGESMIESTSKMMAVSSSVLANTQPKEHGIIEPMKTLATVILSVIAIACMGGIGFLVWKKIAMRRSGRDVLINEDDFDEVSDMHTFDRAQIQIT